MGVGEMIDSAKVELMMKELFQADIKVADKTEDVERAEKLGRVFDGIESANETIREMGEDEDEDGFGFGPGYDIYDIIDIRRQDPIQQLDEGYEWVTLKVPSYSEVDVSAETVRYILHGTL